jgi:hypothetical protein
MRMYINIHTHTYVHSTHIHIKPFNIFRLSFAILSSRCRDKLSKCPGVNAVALVTWYRGFQLSSAVPSASRGKRVRPRTSTTPVNLAGRVPRLARQAASPADEHVQGLRWEVSNYYWGETLTREDSRQGGRTSVIVFDILRRSFGSFWSFSNMLQNVVEYFFVVVYN